MEMNNASHKILVIEDNLGDVILIKEYLQEQFCAIDVSVARNYKESLSILASAPKSFDVILLDLSLPDHEGETLIKEMVGNPTVNCPVIILTGYADIKFSIQSISFGISDYLVKDDLTAVMLYKSITYAIERWEAKLRLEESERKFSVLFNLSPQPMWVYDREYLKFTYVNEAAINHYGYSEEEFFAMDPIQLHPVEEREEIRKIIEDVDSKGLSFSGTFKQIKKNGEEIEVELYSTFLIIEERQCRTVTAVDVTERNMAEINLSKAIIKTQEDERYEIGSELHDNVCQILAGSMLCFETIKPSVNEEMAFIFSQGTSHLKLALNEIRDLSHRLAPAFFDDLNFNESLLQLLAATNLDGRFETHLRFDEQLQSIHLKRDIQINLYRIMQEQLNNIRKHSKASVIDVSLSIISGDLCLQVRDNGVGFSEKKASKGIGFANINRRARLFSGTFRVESSPDNGCKVIVTIPSEHIA